MRLDVLPSHSRLVIDEFAANPSPAVLSPWPFVLVPSSDALSAVESLSQQYSDHVPVILGAPGEAARLIADRDARDASTIISAAMAPGLAHRWRALESEDEAPVEADGPLPSPHASPLVLVEHRTGTAKPEIVIGLVPAAEPADLAAHLGFGGFGRCPPPEVHVALGREWMVDYGAQLISATPETLEYRVARPPSSRDEARALAWVHYRYCPDLVSHLVGSIEGLAATLNGARWWHFWWER